MGKENSKNGHIIIEGPCAVESRDQLLRSAEDARNHGVQFVRGSLWKPRTNPGFEGIGYEGLQYLVEISEMGLIPATEVIYPKHADCVMEAVLKSSAGAKVLLWIGARNQVHQNQRGIGETIAGEKRAFVMVKNPMWRDPEHWKGAVRHVLSGGADPEQILICHRGFGPKNGQYRNPPDLNLALQVKHDLSNELDIEIPLIGDPSHAAGYNAENVIKMAKLMLTQKLTINGHSISFDGLMVEVHPNPKQAYTDNGQQLTTEQFDQILEHVHHIRKI